MRAGVLAVALTLAPVFAAAEAGFARLYDLMALDGYLTITQQEGLEDFPDLAEEMTGMRPDSVLMDQAVKIYDLPRMRGVVQTQMEGMLTDDQVQQALVFIDSPTGARIVELELAARQAMSDPTVEAAAREAWQLAQETNPWLVARIGEVIAAGDLVERNVAGALNSNLRFYQGYVDGGAMDLPEAEMLAEVWGQEESIRADTEEWLGAYLLLAYQPLETRDITDLIAFWQTSTGAALNAAMFAGFNTLYDELSYASARVIALRSGAQEL